MDRIERTIQTYDACAGIYASRFQDIALYREAFASFISTLPRNVEVLDLACGPGNYSRFLLDALPAAKVKGVDLSEGMLRIARKAVPEAEFFTQDMRRLSFPERSFDAVVCSFGFPCLTDEDAGPFVSVLSRLLRPGGRCYISCMEGVGEGFEKASFSGEGEIYLNYFRHDFLAGLFSANGFVIESLREQAYPEQDGSITTDLIYHIRLPLES